MNHWEIGFGDRVSAAARGAAVAVGVTAAAALEQPEVDPVRFVIRREDGAGERPEVRS